MRHGVCRDCGYTGAVVAKAAKLELCPSCGGKLRLVMFNFVPYSDSQDDDNDDVLRTQADARRLRLALREVGYDARVEQSGNGSGRVSGLDRGEGWASVDMSEWPRDRGFPPSVERLLKQHRVWAFD